MASFYANLEDVNETRKPPNTTTLYSMTWWYFDIKLLKGCFRFLSLLKGNLTSDNFILLILSVNLNLYPLNLFFFF